MIMNEIRIDTSSGLLSGLLVSWLTISSIAKSEAFVVYFGDYKDISSGKYYSVFSCSGIQYFVYNEGRSAK